VNCDVLALVGLLSIALFYDRFFVGCDRHDGFASQQVFC